MEKTFTFKIICFFIGIALFALGFQHVYFQSPDPAIFPVDPGVHAASAIAIAAGALLMISGAAIFIARWRQYAALVTVILLLLSLIFLHVPKLLSQLNNGSEWTVMFETLAIMAGAYMLSVSASLRASVHLKVGYLLFALSLFVFAGLHFVYAPFIAALIPVWIPFHLFFAYFVGVAFMAAGISLAIGLYSQLAMNLLGTMFFIWVLFVHAPRVFAHPEIRAEWSSMLIAFLLGCIAFYIVQAKQQMFKPGFQAVSSL